METITEISAVSGLENLRASGNYWVAQTGRKVVFSDDAGASWGDACELPAGTSAALAVGLSGEIAVAHNGRLRIRDPQNSWRDLQQPSDETPSAIGIRGSKVSIATRRGVYSSEDGGRVFDKVCQGDEDISYVAPDLSAIAGCFGSDATPPAAIAVSLDRGKTWRLNPLPLRQ